MKQLCFVFLLLLPVLAIMATTIEVSAPLPVPVFDSVRNSFELSGYGSTTAPGSWQLPVKTMNILLPPGASVSSYHVELLSPTTIPAPEPRRNGRFHSSEGSLGSSASASPGISYIYRGTQAWGDLSFARFDLLPASYDASASAYLWHREAKITLDYDITTPRARNIIPQTLSEPGFFANPEVLPRWYRNTSQRNYDYLIVSTPSLFAAASELDTFRQGQGLITQFADISTILATSPGSNNAAKLRNYLISEYNTSPFTYLLLIGDIDVIPIAQLTPEPNGSETIPSDFYFSDLSSNFDSDNDGRLGEYSTGHGDQDWEVDFTPEVFVGRIAWSTPATVSTICQRIVNFEQSSAPWKNHALLPAAFLNYHQEEWNMEFAETDGAGFMELIRSTIIRDMQTTTLYEQLGVVPSFPSDHALDYDTLKNLISNNSYGLLSWSAHGSATSSSRKVWMEDTDSNGIPDSWEMQWLGMVNRESFNNLANTDGMVVFCASCYNGKIDHSSASLAETVLQKKGVAVIGATRTGWYKIGWQNPGWGGLSSYNYHFLENYITHGMSAGAAQSYANLLHTQYYLFGDPIDSDGIIWPELQNVYTYLMFGDPAVGHTPANPQPQGEILVWEPTYQNGLAIVNAINDLGYYNVVYTDKLIPDYEYLHHFEAVFALFGFGALAYYLEPNSLEYNLLNGYLDSGGKLYVEGLINWDDTDPFWQKFGTIAPY
ncbi:MAG: C25 family cysteine peptidase, partial [Candidatus Cloacimonadaceae bacterium]|nr:C25 family cysteine peptidase [Candidatus Cloacimonadaceae bacterium]